MTSSLCSDLLVAGGGGTMGIPTNYSRDLPNRCLDLLDGLWDHVAGDHQLGLKHGGPLSSTFLLSLAIPIVVLPTERILKQDAKEEGHADDRSLDPEVAERVRADFSMNVKFGDWRCFHKDDGWSYAYRAAPHNFAHGIPHETSALLQSTESQDAAFNLPAETAIRAIRNALAHGVIAYLNADGFGSFTDRAELLALVGERRKDNVTVGYHILRISETGFRSFLHRWVDWLNDTGVAQTMAA